MFKVCKALAKRFFPLTVVNALRDFRRVIGTSFKHYDAWVVQLRLNDVVKRISSDSSRRIRVGFLVIYDKTFQLESVFRMLRGDRLFEARVIVIPDLSRGDENMRKSMALSYAALRKKYGNDVELSCSGDGEFRDVVPEFDVCFVMNPYAGMSHRFYSFEYLSRAGVLVCYSNYAFGEGTANAVNFNHMPALYYLWRFYLDREPELGRMKKKQFLLKVNARLRLVGAAKIDALSMVRIRSNRPITIILAPHHSIAGNGSPLSMGNFDVYADFFLALPRIYPKIQWIFRPHPLLFWAMKKVGVWKEGDEEAYMSKMMSYSNVIYQDSGDYYDVFVNSDGMIQDSGSFLAEYHVTGHPQCYILRDQNTERTQFNGFGREMLSHAYKAYTKKDIINFIENVVLAGNDPMKKERDKFSREKLMFNYPHASEAIVADLKKSLGRA